MQPPPQSDFRTFAIASRVPGPSAVTPPSPAPRPRARFPSPPTCLLHTLHVHEIEPRGLFAAWLLSLDMTIPEFTRAGRRHCTSRCGCGTLCSPVDGYWACLRVSTIMNEAAVNVLDEFSCARTWFLLGEHLRVEFLGHVANLCLPFEEIGCTFHFPASDIGGFRWFRFLATLVLGSPDHSHPECARCRRICFQFGSS